MIIEGPESEPAVLLVGITTPHGDEFVDADELTSATKRYRVGQLDDLIQADDQREHSRPTLPCFKL